MSELASLPPGSRFLLRTAPKTFLSCSSANCEVELLEVVCRIDWDDVGHVPKEILRFVHFFLKHGGSLNNYLSLREAWR